MSQIQTVSATVHEIAHSKLHNTVQQSDLLKDKRTMETETVAVSYTVCQYFSIETGENAFGYLAGWIKNKELPELLKSSLTTIRAAADKLINDIEQHFTEICKEEGISLYPVLMIGDSENSDYSEKNFLSCKRRQEKICKTKTENEKSKRKNSMER